MWSFLPNLAKCQIRTPFLWDAVPRTHQAQALNRCQSVVQVMLPELSDQFLHVSPTFSWWKSKLRPSSLTRTSAVAFRASAARRIRTWFCCRLKRRYGLGQQVTGGYSWVSKGMVQKGIDSVSTNVQWPVLEINVLWQCHLLLQQAIPLRIVFITFLWSRSLPQQLTILERHHEPQKWPLAPRWRSESTVEVLCLHEIPWIIQVKCQESRPQVLLPYKLTEWSRPFLMPG